MFILSPLGGVGAQFLDDNGVPLAGGKIYTYEAGTTTPKTSYTGYNGDVAHTNPIILDSAGRIPGGQLWLFSGWTYKMVLTTSADVTVSTWDNLVNNFVTPVYDGDLMVNAFVADSISENGASPDPTGIILPFAGSAAPTGWLLCDGSVKSVALFSALFAVIGTTFNTGDEGTGNFRLPDLRGRTLLGVGTATGAAGATDHALGSKGGEEKHTLTYTELAAHTHATDGTDNDFIVFGAGAGDYHVPAGGTGLAVTTASNLQAGSAGNGTPHNNLPPFVAVNYIIRT